eukprot:TRINITY_DN5421_c0_g1_i8.p1 TRINITY_DN5421_c0_g1~~TRINITY_DN5421_c0_g1_i8.p1  ORF type:complete len:269 (+),score=79.81 TRINITY_DN5421_c0_g1_i8:1059-1865(+)
MIPSYEYNKTADSALKYVLNKHFQKKKKDFDTIIKSQDPSLEKDICIFEKNFHVFNYKIGVLYAKAGHTTEQEIYSCGELKSDLKEFMNSFSEKISLEKWANFSGGLDTTERLSTGKSSFYSYFKGVDIMFHVGPMIPHNEDDPTRKRHIGNDIVVIIFKEDPEDVIDISSFASKFNHIFVIVSKVIVPNKGTFYKTEVVCKKSIPPFPPYLPPLGMVEKNSSFETFFLTKLINAERTAVEYSPSFVPVMESTKLTMLNNLIDNHTKK